MILRVSSEYVVAATGKLAMATTWDAWGLSFIPNAFAVMPVVIQSQNTSFLCQGTRHIISCASKNSLIPNVKSAINLFPQMALA
nr:hypothetical protein Saspl_041765 [Ipomoea batatas]